MSDVSQAPDSSSESLAKSSVQVRALKRNSLLGGRVTLFAYGEVWRAWLAAFVLVLLLVETGARVVEPTAASPPLRWYDPNTQLRVEMMAETDANVVFVGTSMAWQAFVPDHFDAASAADVESFNAGLVGAVPVVAGPWLLDVVVPAVQPDVVVWGVSSLDLSSSFGDQPFAAWTSALETRADVLGRLDRWSRSYSALLRIRHDFRRPDTFWGTGSAERERDRLEARRVTGTGGERLGFEVDKSERTLAIERARLRNFWIDLDDVVAMELAIRSLQAQGVRVVLVELPVAPSFVALHPQASVDHDKVGQTLGLLAEGLQVEYLDLSEGYAESDFVDFTHLTNSAASRLSKECARALYPT